MLLDNARRARQLRMYATRILNEFKGEVAVEISATFLSDRPKPGFGLVIRDASRAEMLRQPGFTAGEDGMRSVMELVGSSTLKDIVAETTDVVEKMCIQTAVDLTRNNRVAAAEMLGLSRQSLYVKLRKFGLAEQRRRIAVARFNRKCGKISVPAGTDLCLRIFGGFLPYMWNLSVFGICG